MENMPTCITYTPSQGYHFRKLKGKQALHDASNCNTPCGDNNDKYYDTQHGLKLDFDTHVDISVTYLWSEDDAKFQSTKTWFDVGKFPFDGRATTNRYMVEKMLCCTLFDTGASKQKFYNEHPLLLQCSKYAINIQLIQVTND